MSELFILHLDNADKELYTKLLKVISESDCRIHKISSNVKDPSGIILHSDPGSQRTSAAFENCLARKGIIHSFSRKGNPYDNACIESFRVKKKKFISIHTGISRKPGRQSLNILKAGITGNGFTAPLAI